VLPRFGADIRGNGEERQMGLETVIGNLVRGAER
jgi:hypothetical protein